MLILGLSILAAGGVYLYGAYLANVDKSKAAQVTTAEGNVDPATVEQFIRLRDRLTAAHTVLNQHVELSQFFTLLEGITIQNVHFTSLKITVANDRTATIELMGNALDFNALAAESSAFAAQKGIKNAIFSGIQVNKTGGVGFTVDAKLDPSIVVEGAAPTSAALLQGATSTTTSASGAGTVLNSSLQTSQLATSSPTASSTKP